MSAPSSAPSSPKVRPPVKFLCSHGGRILPRPADGHLKYVGGETRVISVPRHISFQELMKKLTYLIEGEMILKYQVISEDLDALVSVKSDEDLPHMFDEIENYEKRPGNPRLRAFLFPSHPLVQIEQIEQIEQRYIDAINGIITRSVPNSPRQHQHHHPTINTLQNGSGCSSPRSTDSSTIEAMNYHNSILSSMHKVQSSPSICGLNGPYQTGPYVHHYRQSQKPPLIGSLPFRNGAAQEKLASVRSMGRYQVDPHVSPQHYYYASRDNRGSGCLHYCNCSNCSDRRGGGNLGMSLFSSSPRGGQSGVRAFDGSMAGDM